MAGGLYLYRAMSLYCFVPFIILFLTLHAGAPGIANAQPYPGQILRPLQFGNFAIVDNSGLHALTININGTYNADPAFVIGSPVPQYAEIRLETPVYNHACNISFNDGYLSLNGAMTQPLFTVTDFTATTPCVTNPDGTILIRVGATIRTNGSGIAYYSGTYSGGFDMIFDY